MAPLSERPGIEIIDTFAIADCDAFEEFHAIGACDVDLAHMGYIED